MATQQGMRTQQVLESDTVFRERALTIIHEMVEMSNTSNDIDYATQLVDEVLHSIFFLGKINDPRFFPEKIMKDEEMLNELKVNYPRPFDLYSSRLPRRSPFSCVLDMVVHLTGERNEDTIINRLRELYHQLSDITVQSAGREKHLISSVICVSQSTESPDSVRYYGVSMSTCGKTPGQIMLAACCFGYWDSDIADAVMTRYPGRMSNCDATIKLPEKVRCKAFNLSDGKPKPPCKSCRDLFGLTTEREEADEKSKMWVCGNCAEVESVSKMFKNEEAIKAQSKSDTCTNQNRERVRERVLKHLIILLDKVGFVQDMFYHPLPPHSGPVCTVRQPSVKCPFCTCC
uniref:uncharacterized protein LOC109953688 isoform X2 n=1 Tax=Monopterus albus TaxID=43700 RepID=UPI0009B33F05|nr:uncharacterized protein LOC109953688 isoform X2 [Monopterus albus]